jgi:hypothetical protein
VRRDLWIRVVSFMLVLPACKCGSDDKIEFVPVDTNGEAKPDTEYDPTVKPVYPTDAKVSPLAEKLCAVLQTLPVARRRECCKTDTGVMLTSECVRNLSGAIALDAVTIDEAKIAPCEAAMNKVYEGCDWVGGLNQPTPPECLGVITGKVKKGDRCRSSLECGEGMRCQGSGPTDPGKCLEPLPEGRLCNTAVDTLATYTRQDDLEIRHPGCQGFCDRNRCYNAVPIGGECKVNVHCGRGHRCKEGKCVGEEHAQLGETCLGGDCAPGLRCAASKCVVPKAAGEPCGTDFDCKAACIDGKCATSCAGLPMILRPKTSTKAQ